MNKSYQLAQENWDRYRYGIMRGHADYVAQAAINDGFYLGGGLQWDAKTKELLGDRMAVEWNEIKPAVNTVAGYQIHNRMDISFLPRGGEADEVGAELLSKVVRQVSDQNKLLWKETEVLMDGCIEQRGYFAISMDFSHNAQGVISIRVCDPRDIIPDPDAKAYDPDEWSDVIETRWLTLDEVETNYGTEARNKLKQQATLGESDFGATDGGGPRSSFGEQSGFWGAYQPDGNGVVSRFRIVDRQKWEMRLTDVAIYPTGEIKIIEDMDGQAREALVAQGCTLERRMRRRVRWVVSAKDTMIHDAVSPYPFINIIPFFPYFRRGKTRGIVDDGISPQRCLNLGMTQFIHILSTAANSGWIVQENSLTNMSTEELGESGAKTGLVMEVAAGSTPPQKITPNTIPTGVDRLIERATQAARDATVPESMRGVTVPGKAGIAIQSDQFASQQQLAVVLDNLSKTRHSLAEKILWLVQNYYTAQRVFRITETDPRTGKDVPQMLTVNQFDPATGGYLNDLTMGEYDVVITTQPMQVTFENSQFEQALEMRKQGIDIPDSVVIKHSNLSDKHDILSSSQGQQKAVEEEARARSERALAEARLKQAQADKAEAETVQTRIQSQFSAVQTAQVIAQAPPTAALGDTLLKSGGYKDQDAPPLLPESAPGTPSAPVRQNTNPLTPLHADVGLKAGFETDKR